MAAVVSPHPHPRHRGHGGPRGRERRVFGLRNAIGA
jgi:hypothetical protein